MYRYNLLLWLKSECLAFVVLVESWYFSQITSNNGTLAVTFPHSASRVTVVFYHLDSISPCFRGSVA